MVDLATAQLLSLCVLVFFVAVLYSSVGHAGASGYLAAMALFGVAPAVMKPAALLLNVLVASVGTCRFVAARTVRWPILVPLVLGSVPAAFLGGAVNLPVRSYQLVLALVLLFAAFRMAWKIPELEVARALPGRVWLVLLGVGIGFLAGLTGVGGGIFLSPVVLFLAWATARETAGVSVVFILVNSASGLLGHLMVVKALPPVVPALAVSALAGGVLGSGLGARTLSFRALRYMLAVVLAIAGLKLIVT